MLNERILAHRLQLAEKFDEVISSRKAYQTFLPQQYHKTLAAQAKEEVDQAIRRVKHDLDDKLKLLIERSRWTELTDISHVHNLTGKDIDINILRVLSLGLNFCQKPSRINLLKALSDIH